MRRASSAIPSPSRIRHTRFRLTRQGHDSKTKNDDREDSNARRCELINPPEISAGAAGPVRSTSSPILHSPLPMIHASAVWVTRREGQNWRRMAGGPACGGVGRPSVGGRGGCTAAEDARGVAAEEERSPRRRGRARPAPPGTRREDHREVAAEEHLLPAVPAQVRRRARRDSALGLYADVSM